MLAWNQVAPKCSCCSSSTAIPEISKSARVETLMGQPDPEGLDIFAMVSKVAGSFEVSGCFS